MRTGGLTLLASVALLVPSLSHAACLQQKAFYTDRDGAYELSFEPVDSDASSSSHRIKVKIQNSDLVLDGYVMPSEPADRSNGMLFNHCPDGDVTGEDLAACTVWDGFIYSSISGKIDLLPQQGAEAAPEILLAGFGASLAQSSAWGAKKATIVPWDVFSLKGCRE
jgi:hypothetical protein